ncbi:MAG: ABC transporter permease [Pirellulaceae bacterium]
MKKIMGILMLLVFICLATALLTNGKFVTPFNIQNIVRRSAFYGIIGIGVAFVIITGGIDLSIGSLIGLVGCLMPMVLAPEHIEQGDPVSILDVNKAERALLLNGGEIDLEAGDQLKYSSSSGSTRRVTINKVVREPSKTIAFVNEPVTALNQQIKVTRVTLSHNHFAVVIGFVLVFTLAIGLIHGLLITKLNLQPFVVTLCGLLIYRGVARWITADTTQGFGSDFDTSFRTWATGSPFPVASLMIYVGIAMLLWLIVKQLRKSTTTGNSHKPAFILGILFSIVLIGTGSLRFTQTVENTQILNLARMTPITIETRELSTTKINAEKNAFLFSGAHEDLTSTRLLLTLDSDVKTKNPDVKQMSVLPLSKVTVESKQTVVVAAREFSSLLEGNRLRKNVKLYAIDLMEMDLAKTNLQTRKIELSPGLAGLLPQIALYFVGFLVIPAFVICSVLMIRASNFKSVVPIVLLIVSVLLMIGAAHWSSIDRVTGVPNGPNWFGADAESVRSNEVIDMFIVFLVLGLLMFAISRFIRANGQINCPINKTALVCTGVLTAVWLCGNTPIGQTQVPAATIWLLSLAVIAAIFLNKTIYGRYLLALGRNTEAAKYSGINTDRMIILAYVICAVCAGIGGILFALDGNSIQPASHGNFYELYAIAAAVLGGCSLRGGEGSITGVVIGAAVMFVLYNAINLLGIPPTLEFAIIGLVILVGAMTDEIAKHFSARKKALEDAAS